MHFSIWQDKYYKLNIIMKNGILNKKFNYRTDFGLQEGSDDLHLPGLPGGDASIGLASAVDP